ncbi:hypothetical protein Pmani_008207 [Petrolisthes manimaculis]|uniref:PiggyBac transposable element-derived protein domain-containing protein n=1 Tax=Petrolisthes manimaculis TaxID=1843537 RepID=A0AAE1Q9B7_9EUCA|nr:hypothetical protein Pmani_008207 [Petrolisthes manimaculis]
MVPYPSLELLATCLLLEVVIGTSGHLSVPGIYIWNLWLPVCCWNHLNMAHHIPLTEKEEEMLVSSKTVAVLVKTLKEPNKSAVYADNFFTSISLVEFLKDTYGCRYVGTA